MPNDDLNQFAAARSAGRERHQLRERMFDPTTIRRLRTIGIQSGWRCLEVGAGYGSIARWLAEAVGPQGHVVATETDTRFLEEDKPPNLEVRPHDIQQADVEPGAYDLVHCRALLGNLQFPQPALQRMRDGLKPGGWLLCEEGDLGSFSAADFLHPGAAHFNRVSRTISDALLAAGVMHSYLGRGLPKLLDQCGLLNVQNEGTTRIERGGDDGAQFMTGFTEVLRPQILAAGLVTEADLVELDRLFRDPSFSFVNFTLFAAWGQRA